MTFHYRANRLYCENVFLGDIADAVGTPVYVYSAARMLENACHLQNAFPNAEVYYSMKANANLTLIRRLHEIGLGMDAVSGGEIFRAVQAGVDPGKIVFAGVGKTADELRYALEVGVGWVNVESEGELALLNQLAREKAPQVALRLNPDVRARTHRYIATGHGGAKFGMSAAVVAQALEHQDDYPNLRIRGIHVHIGSQLGDVDATVAAVRQAQAVMRPYPELRTLNLGGGFPVKYSETDDPIPPETFAEVLTPLLAGWRVKLEPGRCIIADAGALVMSTLYTKTQGGHHFAITDGSMTELIRPALYEAAHPILPVVQSDEAPRETIVAGPVCESADILRDDAPLPTLQPGDRLAVMVAGAYGFVMASNYNQRPRPPEVLVEGDDWTVIRRRETWDDLIRLENQDSASSTNT